MSEILRKHKFEYQAYSRVAVQQWGIPNLNDPRIIGEKNKQRQYIICIAFGKMNINEATQRTYAVPQ